MFCGKLKQEYQAAKQSLAERERDIAALRAELAKLESERDALRGEATGAKTECDVAHQIYGNMQNFGVSFVELQQSQAAAANALREERKSAVEAAKVSSNNREAVMKIADSLEALSGDTGSSPNTFLQVSAAAGISYVVITADPNGGSFALDDLTITPFAGAPAITSEKDTNRPRCRHIQPCMAR